MFLLHPPGFGTMLLAENQAAEIPGPRHRSQSRLLETVLQDLFMWSWCHTETSGVELSFCE